LTVQEK